MTEGGKIDEILEIYLKSTSWDSRKVLFEAIIDYFIYQGPSNFRLNFWTKLSIEQKEQFIKEFFNYLIEVKSGEKLNILDLLEALYLDASLRGSEEEEVKNKLFYIFYAALFEKRNYKLALAGLEFFSHLWKNSEEDDPIRNEIFPKLLDFCDNKDELLVQEGVFEFVKLLDSANSDQVEEAFRRFIEMAHNQKDPSAQYAIFEGINEIIIKHLSDLKTFVPPVLTTTVLSLLENKLKHPKPIFSLLRLVFANKFPMTEKAEQKIMGLLKIAYEQITFEYMGQFWQSLFDFLQGAGYISRNDILKPYLKKMQDLFKHRGEIAPEVELIIENMVNWLWEMNVLTDAQCNAFY
jgi:hypothetical protein